MHSELLENIDNLTKTHNAITRVDLEMLPSLVHVFVKGLYN